MTRADHRFPRKERLKGRDEIREVFSRQRPGEAGVSLRRKGVACPGAKLLTRRNGLQHNRIAFTFSRKYGNAVERNYSRRLSRETYRLLRNELKTGYDLVLLVYPGRDDFKTRMDQLRLLFFRAGLFIPSQSSGGSQSSNQE